MPGDSDTDVAVTMELPSRHRLQGMRDASRRQRQIGSMDRPVCGECCNILEMNGA
ncbi:MAG: hypothetical protein JWM95_522 [Gemmatimonadetes bacterium]|nr:hypothetical protein [Gemmatimonadota bacterium]